MSYTLVPRTDIGLPEVVRSSTGAPRPHIGYHNPWLTAHYTGVSSRGYETADVAREVLRIQEIFEATKPFEYNWVIGQNEDDLIYEFAGHFMAAHSAGENLDAVGVLFLNATFEPLTPTQIKKAQWVRDVLQAAEILAPRVNYTPHRDMPGAATACPGDLILQQLPQVQAPYVPPAPPIEEENMVSYIVIPPAGRAGNEWLVVVGGQVRPATTYDLGKFTQWQMTDRYAEEQYDALRRAAGLG